MIFFISYWNNSDLGPAKDRYNEILKTITKNKKKIIITSTTSKDIKFYKKINNRILIKRFNIFKLLNFINFILITQFVLIGYSKQIKCVIVTSSKLFSLLPVVILKKLSNHQFYLIYDINGQSLASGILPEKLSLSNYTSGVYLMEISDQTSSNFSIVRIIKK